MLERLKIPLKERTVILGIGNTLRSDDGIGSILANRLKDKLPYTVYDGASSPENYLGKIIKDKPETTLIIDAVDFGAKPGEFRLIKDKAIKAKNLFFTHNASLELVLNYLQNNLKTDIIILIIQPESIAFGDKLSLSVNKTLIKLEKWFSGRDGTKRHKRE